MRWIIIGLVLVVVGFQYKIWFGTDSLPKWFQAEKKLNSLKTKNEALSLRNHALEVDIRELKSGEEALEERARYDLGMVKDNETYYHFVN